METVLIVARQIAIMFLFMALGWIMFKTKLLTEQGAKDFSNLLLRFVVPAILITSFIVERTPEKTSAFFLSFALAFGSILISVVLSRLLFRDKHVIEHFASAFSNAGFFGIPIVQAFLGEEAVFYIASFVMMTFFFQWTYGVFQFTKDKSMFQAKKLLTNPVIIGFAIALFLFFTQIPVPEIITTPLSMIAALNTPLAMIILGVYLAKSRFLSIFTDKKAYLVAGLRLVVFPLVILGLLSLLPAENNPIRLAILIPACAPVGANVAIFAGLYDQDYAKSVRFVCLSTLLSILTIPVLVALAEWLWT